MPFVRSFDLYLLTVIACLEIARRLPFMPVAGWFAAFFTTVAYYLSRTKRKQIESRLVHAFGETMDAHTRREVARACFSAFWSDLFSWARPSHFFAENTRVSGTEHIRNGLAQGKGVILWESNGFGNRVAAQAIFHNLGFGLVQLHAFRHTGGIGAGDERGSWVFLHLIRPFFERIEQTRVSEVVYLPRDSSLAFTRTLAARLAANCVLCVAAEGPNGHKRVTVPFLGHYFSFATGMPNLAQLSGAPLIPFFCTLDSQGVYTIEILPPLTRRQGQDRISVAFVLAEYAKLLDTRIRANPGAYRHWDSQHLLAEKPVQENVHAN